jgi:predicted nucleic acid-binding protein
VPSVWVVNASPLIFLGRLGRFDLLPALADEVLVPEPVLREVRVRDSREALQTQLANLERVRFEPECPVPANILAWDLGPGESQVVSITLSNREAVAVLDDLQARRCAIGMGMRVMGTIGVLLRAKRAELIPAVRPLMVELVDSGMYLDPDLMAQALAEVGE